MSVFKSVLSCSGSLSDGIDSGFEVFRAPMKFIVDLHDGLPYDQTPDNWLSRVFSSNW